MTVGLSGNFGYSFKGLRGLLSQIVSSHGLISCNLRSFRTHLFKSIFSPIGIDVLSWCMLFSNCDACDIYMQYSYVVSC